MTEYKCDRCGGPRKIRPRINFVIKDKIVDSIGWVKLCSPTGYVMTLDLCEKCMFDLANFMANGGSDNGGSEN